MATRRAICTLFAVLVVWGLAPPVPSLAQEADPVRLILRTQTPWTTPDQPALRVSVAATSQADVPFGGLVLETSFGTPFASRFEYEASFSGGTSSAIAAVPTPIDGDLEPGQTRTLTASTDLSALPAIATDDSKVYPLRIRVLSEGLEIGSLTSAHIHLVRAPEVPLGFTSWLELARPEPFSPSGTLVDPSFEAALGPLGALGAPVNALRAVVEDPLAAAAFDLVIQPSLVADVVTMTDGYVRADGTEVPEGGGGAQVAELFLTSLRAIVASPRVQVVALPFARPSYPALVNARMDGEARIQLTRASQTIRATLDAEVTTEVARPTEGLLDDASLRWLVGQGRWTILADADEVARPERDLGFAPAATASVPAGDAGEQATLVLPDPATQALFARGDLLADPVRGAQAVLGELAVIWKEEPGTERALALGIPSTLPPTMWQPLLARLSRAPFLDHRHAQEVAEAAFPAGAVLAEPDTDRFTDTYASSIRGLRQDISAYESMLVLPSQTPGNLRDDLLRAQAVEFVGDEPAGSSWLTEAAAVTSAAFENTTPEVQQLFTFTSREGTIPLRMGDPGPTPLRVTIQLLSSQFEFPSGDEQTIVLERPDQIVTFDVVAKASGRNPIQVLVLAPSGRAINSQTVTVQTTAVSGIALAITVVAGMLLVGLYARRWVLRRRTS